MNKKLTPKQIEKLVSLRLCDPPVTIPNLSIRYGVSERTIYYYLAQWRRATECLACTFDVAVPES